MEAALDLLEQARRAEARGEDEDALRLVAESLEAHDSDEARSFQKQIEAVALMLVPRASHYQILQVSKDATLEQLKKAYKTLSLVVHPDRNGARRAEEAFKVLSQAFSVLSVPASRTAYDLDLGRARHGKAQSPKGGRTPKSAPPTPPGQSARGSARAAARTPPCVPPRMPPPPPRVPPRPSSPPPRTA